MNEQNIIGYNNFGKQKKILLYLFLIPGHLLLKVSQSVDKPIDFFYGFSIN